MQTTPERSPEYYQDPFLQKRSRMLKAYNAQLSQLRVNGIRDHVGHRVYGAEKMVRSILTSALTQTDKARNLETLQRIQSETERKLQEAQPIRNAA